MDESNQGRSGGSSNNRNRSRNNNRNRSHGGGGGQGGNRGGGGGGNRNRNRNRSRKKRPTPPPVTFGEKILYYLTFGNAGRIDPTKFPKGKEPQKSGGKTNRYGEEVPERFERPDKTSGPKFEKAERPAKTEKPADSKPKRAPRKVEVTSGRLYVGNLVYEANETDLEDLFRGIGTVNSTEIVVNSRTQQSKGFAFVEMNSVEEAKRAVDVLHDKDFMGRKLLVTGAKSDGPRDGSDDEQARDDAENTANQNA